MTRQGEEKTCHFCLLQGQQLLVCSRCRNSRYCSRPCQKAHWKGGHKLECTSYDSERWMNRSKQHDVGSSTNYLSIVKELYNEVQRDSLSLDEAHSRMRRAQDEADRLKSELEALGGSRRKTRKTYSPLLRTRNDITSELPSNCAKENNYNQSEVSPMMVQEVHNKWKFLVEDLTNINCYSIFLTPFSQQTTGIPKEKKLCLSIIPSSSSSWTQVTLRLVNDSDERHSSDTAVDKKILLSITVAETMDSDSIWLATHVDCITLRLMYDKELQRHLKYRQTLPKTTPLHLLKGTLACKSCHSKLLIDAVNKVKLILPLPSGYWDEVADYLMCYEGDSTLAFSSSSYNAAIQGCILEDSSVFVMHKEYLGSNVEVLAIEGYGEPVEHPIRKIDMKLSESTTQSNSCNVTTEEEAQGRANTVPVAGDGGVLYRGERRWRDLTGGGATLCCSQCCSILGFASNTSDNFSAEPPFRLYKHRLIMSGIRQHSKNNCGTFIAHQMVRYAEGQAVFSFYIIKEKSRCSDDRLDMKPNCLLLKLISWDTQIAEFNQEEEITADSFRFENSIKVIFQERIVPYEVDSLPLSPLLFWNNIDLCCPPKESRNGTLVDEKNLDGIGIQKDQQTTTASVKIFLSWDEWNELRSELLSKRFPSSIVAGTDHMKFEMSSSGKGFYEGVSFLPLT